MTNRYLLNIIIKSNISSLHSTEEMPFCTAFFAHLLQKSSCFRTAMRSVFCHFGVSPHNALHPCRTFLCKVQANAPHCVIQHFIIKLQCKQSFPVQNGTYTPFTVCHQREFFTFSVTQEVQILIPTFLTVLTAVFFSSKVPDGALLCCHQRQIAVNHHFTGTV